MCVKTKFDSSKFHRRGISHDHLSPQSFPDLWVERYWEWPENWPPLLHALDQGFYLLAAFLLSHGASFEEPVGPGLTVFDRALSPTSLSSGTAQFMFYRRGEYFEPSGKTSPINTSLLPSHLFEEGNGYHILGLLAAKWNQPAVDDMRKYWPLCLSTSPRLVPKYPDTLLYPLRNLRAISAPLILLKSLSWILSVHLNIIISTGKYHLLFTKLRNENYPGELLYSRTYSDFCERVHLPVFSNVWIEMLSIFPDTRITGQLKYGNLTYEPHSLLEISIAGYPCTVASVLT